jgi:Winged helix-turn helix
VWKLLRRRLGWCRQRPARRAVGRDEQAIARWVERDWPRIRETVRRRRAVIVFCDESGASLLPVTRRTWAPRGITRSVEPLPGYAPDLNPVEALWSNLQAVELVNLAGETLQDTIAAAGRGIQRIRQTHHLAYSFLRHCGLSLWCAVITSPEGANFFSPQTRRPVPLPRP